MHENTEQSLDPKDAPFLPRRLRESYPTDEQFEKYDGPRDDLQIPLNADFWAAPNCKGCYGKGSVNGVRMVKSNTFKGPQTCSCAMRRYRHERAKRVGKKQAVVKPTVSFKRGGFTK